MVKYCLPPEISNRQQCLLFNINFNYSCDAINKTKDVRIGKKYLKLLPVIEDMNVYMKI